MTLVPPEPTYITASIAPFHSLSQHFAYGHLSAEKNKRVKTAMQSAYDICHSDKAFYHPEETRDRVTAMFSKYNQEFLDDWKKHPSNTMLFALRLAPEKVDTRLGIEDDQPDDLWDVPGRRDRVDFPFGIMKETLEELKEDVGCLHDRVHHRDRLDEERLYRVRDDWDDCLTEAEQTGLRIWEEKNSAIISDCGGKSGLP